MGDNWVTIDGRHVDLGASGAGTPLTKAEKARLAYKGGDKREQDIAEATEREMSAALGMPRTGDNRAFDLQSRKYGVEIKSIVSGANEKVTMNAKARTLKAEAERDHGIKGYTLVVDKRPAGIGSSTGTTRYFVKQGYGSFRLGAMTQVKSPAAAKAFIYGGAK